MARSAYFHSVAELWRQPNFAWYMGGQTVSLVGMWAQRIAIGWLAWELTGSNFWLGAIAFADLFPTIGGTSGATRTSLPPQSRLLPFRYTARSSASDTSRGSLSGSGRIAN